MGAFHFQGYTLRPAVQEDGAMAREWTLADPYHKDTTPYTFWLEQGKYGNSYLLSDREGALFFFKMVWVEKDRVQLHIQFKPEQAGDDQRRRIVAGITIGLHWLEEMLLQREIKEVFFDSKSPGLVKVCVGRLGFAAQGERLAKVLQRKQTAVQ